MKYKSCELAVEAMTREATVVQEPDHGEPLCFLNAYALTDCGPALAVVPLTTGNIYALGL